MMREWIYIGESNSNSQLKKLPFCLLSHIYIYSCMCIDAS